MTSTARAAEDSRVFGLHAEPEQVQHPDPDGRAPEERDHQADVEVPAGALRMRIHVVTVLLCIVAAQLAWLAALTWGLYSLLH